MGAKGRCVRDHNRFIGVGPLKLSKVVYGAGPDLVLLHGWGMNSQVLKPTAQALAARWRVNTIDLPGYGVNHEIEWPESWESLTHLLLDAAPPKAVWMGWSLGGMLAIHAASIAPGKVSGLVLLSATPRFIADADWPCALPLNVFKGFVDRFERDAGAALSRFDLLQFQGASNAMESAHRLRDMLGQRAASNSALRRGLHFLLTADFRNCLLTGQQRLGAIYGDNDALIPSCYGQGLVDLVPHATVIQIKDAGHAPFITHRNEVVAAVNEIMTGYGDE